ncbi:hypothetical protein KR093_000116 [Drosophila rubida]|uniref:Uncharacterized protein n=1 Tax=Drosophila rubida TaxID=30044 RepID=A0AAD4PM20_9MUSC|nr:hypothetical protein KR093_000116 [Drosophila rubida]
MRAFYLWHMVFFVLIASIASKRSSSTIDRKDLAAFKENLRYMGDNMDRLALRCCKEDKRAICRPYIRKSEVQEQNYDEEIKAAAQCVKQFLIYLVKRIRKKLETYSHQPN